MSPAAPVAVEEVVEPYRCTTAKYTPSVVAGMVTCDAELRLEQALPASSLTARKPKLAELVGQPLPMNKTVSCGT